MYANPSNFKVSQCLFFTDRIKQGSQSNVLLLYSQGFSFTEVQEGLRYKSAGSLPCVCVGLCFCAYVLDTKEQSVRDKKLLQHLKIYLKMSKRVIVRTDIERVCN